MKWIPHDIEMYLNAKEFVDTAVIPLVPISFGEEMKQAASMSEFITLVTTLLERQFTGRILLLPPIAYITNADYEKILNELITWTRALYENNLNHIFFITSDRAWENFIEEMNGTLVWIPNFEPKNLENCQKNQIIDSYIKQLLTLFTQKWHGD